MIVLSLNGYYQYHFNSGGKHMRKKAAAIVLSFSMVASTWMPAATVQATEYEESTTEYVVQLEDAQSVEEVLEENAEAILEKEESDDLKEEQVLVLNLTPSEAEALENREDVVSIEENYDKEVYDGIGIFAPVEKNVMLNNLKKYSKEAGMDITCFTDTEWAKISTPDMY